MTNQALFHHLLLHTLHSQSGLLQSVQLQFTQDPHPHPQSKKFSMYKMITSKGVLY